MAQSFRPGHALYLYTKKYYVITAAVGRSSARETAMRVVRESDCENILAEKFGILIVSCNPNWDQEKFIECSTY